MSNARSVHGVVPAHGVTSATATTVHPPFHKFTVSEKKDEITSRFTARVAVNTSFDLVEIVVSGGVHNARATAMFNMHVVEKFGDLFPG